MAQTPEGARKVRDAMLARDPDFYKKIGAKGGKTTGFKGFALMTEKQLKKIVTKGGKASRRGRKKQDGREETPDSEATAGFGTSEESPQRTPETFEFDKEFGRRDRAPQKRRRRLSR